MSEDNKGSTVSVSEYRRAVNQAVSRKRKLADLQKQYDDLVKRSTDLETSVKAITKERDDAVSRADTAPSELQERLDAALATIRERNHRDKINELVSDPELAKTLGGKIRPEAIEPLLKFHGYKPEDHETEKGEIDPKRLRETLVNAAKSNAAWAVASDTAGVSAEVAKPGPAGGRGNAPIREGESTKQPDRRDLGGGRFRLG